MNLPTIKIPTNENFKNHQHRNPFNHYHLMDSISKVMRTFLAVVLLAACTKSKDHEPKPADKRVQEQVKQLQGWVVEQKY